MVDNVVKMPPREFDLRPPSGFHPDEEVSVETVARYGFSDRPVFENGEKTELKNVPGSE